MKKDKKAGAGQDEPTFEVLRARIEARVGRPGVLVVTSAIAGDGKSVAAHGLASSLASIGCRTLLVDAGKRSGIIIQPPTSASIEEIVLESACETTIPGLKIVSLTSPALQRKTGLPSVARALTVVRGSYDYIVVDGDCALNNALSAHFVSSADAVLVAVRAGRRRQAEDAELAEALGDLDAKFFGVVAVSPAMIGVGSNLVRLRGAQASRGIETGHLDREPYLRNARPGIEL